MRKALVFVSVISVICVLPGRSGFSQQRATDDEAIKAVFAAETKAFFARDFNTWESTWAHDPDVTRTLVATGSQTQKGWPQISSTAQDDFKQPPQSLKPSMNNFVVHADGNIAAVEYDQILTEENGTQHHSHEQRVLVKKDNGWKIASQITIVVDAFGDTPENVEQTLNVIGYRVLGAGRVNDAIEVFKLNVQLNPKSWNVYDSLGEAYAKAGNKALAIQNYEKSIQLNPKNENGKVALAKLKGM
jgi:tetratricopeptide (TPR) repeat protein